MPGSRLISIAVCAAVPLLAGCGSTIGQFDDLPVVELDEETPWPRLVDTPEPPEARLTAGTGGAALVRLNEGKTASVQRKLRAEQVQPVPDALADRTALAQTRSAAPMTVIRDDTLAARAALSQERTAPSAPAAPIAIPRNPGSRTLDTPVLSADFDERARRALERAARGTNP